MSKKKQKPKLKKTIVLSKEDLPEGVVEIADYTGLYYTEKTDKRKVLHNAISRAKLRFWVIYPDGQPVLNARNWVMQSEADAYLTGSLAELKKREQSIGITAEIKQAPKAQPAAPVVNNRLLAALESIAGSLEMIAEVAVDHAKPAPMQQRSVLRSPSLNGEGSLTDYDK